MYALRANIFERNNRMTDSSILTADPKNTAKKLETFRSIRPLVHCITNEVVQEITANVLLAAGASPAMVVGEGETEQFASIANAVSVNVGTPYENRVAIMKKAARAASEAGRPWVLDPVAAGGMPWRNKIIFELLELGPAAVRGNASEIRFLAGVGTGGKGVDSLDSSEQAVEAAKTLAKKYKTLVVVTGETDYATDGERVLAARGGNPMITLVVGTGCSLSSLLAGFIGANGASVETCIACCDYVNRAGELAAARAKGPGSFHCEYLDALWLLQPGNF